MSRQRPTAVTEEELGFQPRPAVRWLDPSVLIRTGVQAAIAAIFGSYADKRELQGSLPATVYRYTDDDELWFDFVADLGDGFDATYTVARLLAKPRIDDLPRGRLLVMGGDQVYPSAGTRAYEDRSKGVYRAALPDAGEDPPTLFALPGNHDWYDGLTSFLRVFAQRRPFGGWDTEQTRSYFAIQLPHRWWLLAIDTQFDDYVDGPQLEYFKSVSQEIQPGDGVILCTSAPAWVPAGSGIKGPKAKGWDTIEFFDREIVRSRQAEIRVMLTGDKHHYARYAEADGRQKITAGLGGAYLAATHELPESLELPPAASRVRDPSAPAEYRLVASYPDPTTSRRFASGIFRLPFRNPRFWLLTGVFQTLMTLAVLYGLVGTLGSASVGFFGLVASWTPAIIVGTLLVLGGLAFAGLDAATGTRRAAVAGVLHACAHLAVSVGWAFVVIWLYRDVLPDGLIADWSTLILVLAGTPLVIGLLDAELVAAYLMIASRFGINLNEVMAGQSIEDYKGFLRIKVDRDGVTIHPLAIPTVCRSWKINPDTGPGDSWLVPTGAEPTTEPMEKEPVVVTRTSAGHTPTA